MSLQTNGLDLREVELKPLNVANIKTHFEWNNDPELNYFDSEQPYEVESFADFKRRFEHMLNDADPSMRDFEIHAEDGTLIGLAYVININPHHRHATIGVTLGDRNYWGKGYGRASMRKLLAYCFETMNLHRVSAETFEYNDAWRRLVVGMGFSKEGVARDYLQRDGQFWDKEVYALLKPEYDPSIAL